MLPVSVGAAHTHRGYVISPNVHSRVSVAVQMKGEAEAFALEAKGRAEAEQMTKKAEAFTQYKEGAMVDMLLEKLPLVRPLLRPLTFTRLSRLYTRQT